MNEHEIAVAILGAAGGIAAAIRWGVKRLARAQDRGTEALIKNAESHGVLATKLDAFGDKIDRLAAVLEHEPEPVTARHRRQHTVPRGHVIPIRPDDSDH